MQPYKPDRGGEGCPLWLLHELARRERHRLLMLTSGKVWTSKSDEADANAMEASADAGSRQMITVALHASGPAKGANVFVTCDRIYTDVAENVIPALRAVFPAA